MDEQMSDLTSKRMNKQMVEGMKDNENDTSTYMLQLTL